VSLKPFGFMAGRPETATSEWRSQERACCRFQVQDPSIRVEMHLRTDRASLFSRCALRCFPVKRETHVKGIWCLALLIKLPDHLDKQTPNATLRFKDLYVSSLLPCLVVGACFLISTTECLRSGLEALYFLSAYSSASVSCGSSGFVGHYSLSIHSCLGLRV